MPDEQPLISIIIPSWNRTADLAITLESIYRQDYTRYEIIVVDNGSTDNAREFLENHPRPLKTIYNGRNLGASTARNQGILASEGSLLLFMDSDAVIVDPSTFSRMVDAFARNPRLGALALPIYLDEAGTIPWVFGLYFFDDCYTDWERTHTETADPDSLCTCFVMVRREPAIETGGFDPVYFYQHEDLDFFLRFDRLGYEKALLPDLRIWHRNSFSGRRQDRMFWMQFREEWKHQYLVLKNIGIRKGAGFIFRNMFDPGTVQAYYVHPIRRRKLLVLWVALPLAMLLASPWIVLQRRRNYLNELRGKSREWLPGRIPPG